MRATETIINREGWMIGDGGTGCVEGDSGLGIGDGGTQI